MARAETRLKLLKKVIVFQVILKLETVFPRTLDRNGRFEMEDLKKTSGSRVGFFSSGLMTTVFNSIQFSLFI